MSRNRRSRRDVSRASRRLPRASSAYDPGVTMGFRRKPSKRRIQAAVDRSLRYPQSVMTLYPLSEFGFPNMGRRANVNTQRVKKISRPRFARNGTKAVQVFQEKSICEKRSERSEVMHAIGKAGKGGQKSPRFTSKSKVRCK